MSIDYKLCSVQELAEHFLVSHRSVPSQQLCHYRKSGNAVMISKIMRAKLMMKVMKMEGEIKLLNS